MRILLVTPFVPHTRVGHGTATVAAHVVRHLVVQHQVTVACFSFSDHERALATAVRETGADVRVVPFPHSRLGEWRARAASIYRGIPYTIELFQVAAMRRLLTRLVSATRFDVAQFDTTFVGPYVDLMPAETRTALVEIDFTVKPLARRLQQEQSPLKRRWYQRELDEMRRYEPALCRRFDRVIAVSDEDRAALMALDRSLAVDVFRYGADPDLFSIPYKTRNDHSVLFMGAFLHRPNSDAVQWLASEILPRMRAELPSVSVLCVGGDPPVELRKQAEASGAVLTGWVPDVSKYLARADVGIVPLRAGGGVKLKTLEMMAAGRAIVTTPIGVEGTGAIDGEHVLIADTAPAFAAAVVRLLGDDRLRHRLAVAARELAWRDHQWPVNLEQLEAGHRELVFGTPLAATAV